MMDIKQQNWWIYQGDLTLDSIKDKKPKWRDKSRLNHNAKAFVPFNKEIIDAVNSAIYLRRPLLVTGEPGIGKSSLAKSIATNLGINRVLQWQITSKSVLKDALYSYDALARLHDIQMKKLYFELKDKTEEIDEYSNISTSIENYLKLGVLGTAFISEEPQVVLIDEIDKSDIDLPNDLLHIFEEQEFVIEELKRIKSEKYKNIEIEDANGIKHKIPDGKVECRGDFPIIVITSNNEREFSPAFLRRCISVYITLPNEKKEKIKLLKKMVEAHFIEAKNDENIDKFIEYFIDLKDKGLRSNDQLLNAIYLILNQNMDYKTFKNDFEKTILNALE